MNAQIEEIIARAEGYLGVKEAPANSNNVIFNTRYYAREVSGPDYPWCAVFIWCLFQDIGAPSLYFGGSKSASCTTLFEWYKREGQSVPTRDLRRGDLVFFNFDGNTRGVMNHIGLCVEADGATVTTIDGNTGLASDADGGAVMQRVRDRRYVSGAARPEYEEVTMTNQEVMQAIANAVEAAAPKRYTALAQVPVWAQALVSEAMERGIIKGDGTGSLYLTDDNLVNLQMLKNVGLF